jgi:hypothetical protein
MALTGSGCEMDGRDMLAVVGVCDKWSGCVGQRLRPWPGERTGMLRSGTAAGDCAGTRRQPGRESACGGPRRKAREGSVIGVGRQQSPLLGK